MSVRRTWSCDSCRATYQVSYEELANSGTPVCPTCDKECDLIADTAGTYRELALVILEHFTVEQLDADITIENYNGECFPAKLAICGLNHDDGHPVILEI